MLTDSCLCRGEAHHEKPIHELRYVDVEKLNSRIEGNYKDFMESAPLEWTRDGFLSQNVPISIAVRYGQNQLICHRQDREREQEREHWDRLHDYSNIRTVTVALATHVK